MKNTYSKISGHVLYEQLYRVALALIIGICTGLSAVLFRKMITIINSGMFRHGEQMLSCMGSYYIILLPMVGGLIVGPLTYFLSRESKGPGIGEVIAAVAVRGGHIRPRVVPIKILASAICIGSGGSAGRVGPIVQIGAAIGSTVGQLTKVPTSKMRALVACGAAGGIAATFNAPIGGVIFALEVILGNFAGAHLMMVIISSVTAAVIGIIFFGTAPAFIVPAYTIYHPTELLFYILLGFACGIFAVFYTYVYYKTADIFNMLKFMPGYLKPALGGLLVGLIGVFLPPILGVDFDGITTGIFGVGFEGIEMAITGKLVLSTMLALLVIKLIATSLTIGSGSSGGVFAPGLFMGAMLGSSFGYVMNFLFPQIAPIPAAYALVGMGGLIAGIAHAPITAIIMLFEMSNDYHIILPVMITCILSSVVSKTIYKYNIYVVKLVRRGLDIDAAMRPDILKNVLVKDMMTSKIETIPCYFTIKEAWELVQGSPHRGFPVITREGLICGIVTIKELAKAITGDDTSKLVNQIATHHLVTVIPYEPISAAVKRMDTYNIGRLPVVDPDNAEKIVGLLSRTDIISAYTAGLLKEDELEESFVTSPTQNN